MLLFTSCVYFKSIAIFVTSRILLGCQYGAAVVIVYLYAVEISPLKYKSITSSLVSTSTYFGSVLAFVLGLDYLIDGRKFWPYLTCVASIFSILQVLFMYFIPESPTYLFSVKKYEAGRKVIQYLFGGKLDQSDFDLKEESDDSRIKRLSQIDTSLGHQKRMSIRSAVEQEKFEKKFKKSVSNLF